MSAITESTKAFVAPFDDKTPEANVTYTFETTEENKTESAHISLTSDVAEHVKETVARSGRWRSDAQFFNDALIHYINGGKQSESVQTILDDASWNTEYNTSFRITETLWKEINLLVKNGHTEWSTKQEFYICALYCYVGDNYPIVERR